MAFEEEFSLPEAKEWLRLPCWRNLLLLGHGFRTVQPSWDLWYVGNTGQDVAAVANKSLKKGDWNLGMDQGREYLQEGIKVKFINS